MPTRSRSRSGDSFDFGFFVNTFVPSCIGSSPARCEHKRAQMAQKNVDNGYSPTHTFVINLWGVVPKQQNILTVELKQRQRETPRNTFSKRTRACDSYSQKTCGVCLDPLCRSELLKRASAVSEPQSRRCDRPDDMQFYSMVVVSWYQALYLITTLLVLALCSMFICVFCACFGQFTDCFEKSDEQPAFGEIV
uniref:Uncharacterized protein n=1 Tax=Steinernema glaseri TaxID=37863 RepID=A0A1I8AL57_9BILA